MAVANARLEKQTQLGYVPHTSVSGDAWSMTKRGIATSSGAAGGTTLIDTGGDSGGADTYNGQYWVRMTTGANQNQWRRIVDDDGAGTLTLEGNGFDAQVASGNEYEIWQTPEPVITVTTSNSTTSWTASVRTEATDTWVGYYAVVVHNGAGGGAVAGEIQKISASTSSGVITVDTAFSAAPAVGDVILIRKFVDFAEPADGTEEAYIPRGMSRLNFQMGDGVIGPRSGTFGFSAQVRASGTTTGDGVNAGDSESHGLFEACGIEEKIDKSTSVGIGSSTTDVKITTASWENYTIGNAIVVNNEVAWITAMTDGAGAVDTLTVAPALSLAPDSGDVAHATRGYHKSTDGDVFGCVLDYEMDGVRLTMTGCKGNVTVQGDEIPVFRFEFQIDHFTRELEAAAHVAVYSTARAVRATDRLAYLGATKTNIGGFTCTPGTVSAPRKVQGSAGINGRVGHQLVDYAAQCTWKELLDADTATLPQNNRFDARTSSDLAVVYGDSSNGFFAFRIPAARHIAQARPTPAEGMLEVTCLYEAQAAGFTNDGGGTSQKVPDWSFCIT